MSPAARDEWDRLQAYQDEYAAYADQAADDAQYARAYASAREQQWGEAAHSADWHAGRAASRSAAALGARGRGAQARAFLAQLGDDFAYVLGAFARKRWLLKTLLISFIIAFGSAASFGLLWLRLGSGPVNIDFVTPWMVSAIKETFGPGHLVEIGGTQIERAGRIRMAVRLRDVVVRDAEGATIASAPKAEVKVSAVRLLAGRLRAEGLSLVNAGLAVRIATDGRVTISAAGSARPLASAELPLAPADGAPAAAEATAQSASARGGVQGLLAAMAWLDSLSVSGLDGHDLSELGFRDGNLVIDDQQSGKQWTFEHVTLTLRKPASGGVSLSVSEESPQRSWLFRASVGKPVDGVRGIDIIADSVRIQDMLLAMRWTDLAFTADVPLTGRLRGEIGRDGLPTFLTGKLLGDEGEIIDRQDPRHRVKIDRAEITFDWDASRRTMVAPFQIVAGGNRFTLLAHLDPPNGRVPYWQLGVTGGTIVLVGAEKEGPLVFNRIDVRFQFKTGEGKVVLERADFSNGELGVAGSGVVEYASADPRFAIGFAGTKMSVSAFKRIWPAMMAPAVRTWVLERVDSGTVHRFDLGLTAPLNSFGREGQPLQDDAVSLDVVASDVTLRPVASLPELRDTDIRVRVTGRTATVTANQANIETPGGRKLTLHDLVFEVPDTTIKPARARARFRAEGPVPAGAELLAMDAVAGFPDAPLDPQASKGTLSAKIGLELPLKDELTPADTSYTLNIDLANLSADRLVFNQRLEASALRITGTNESYLIKGDVKIGGQPAALEYRRRLGQPDADIRLQMTLDDAARARFGLEFGSGVSGPVPVKLTGKAGAPDRESRFSLEADLTAAKIDNVLPSWVKPAGKASRAAFVLVQKPQSTRFEDIVIDGGGATIKGMAEFDRNGELMSASFPVFHPSEADKASIKAERNADGPLKVTMRGELFDGRGFVKAAVSGHDRKGRTGTGTDLDLDVKLGTVAGYYGEAMRALDVKMSRRAGIVRSFSLSGKLGRDAPITGDLRGRVGGRDVLYVETNDAGAFFRFTDTYPKIFGGQMWVAMDPPTPNNPPQDGLLNVRDFVIKGEGALDRVVANNPSPNARGVEFSHMRVEFTRQPGKLTINDGVLRGPAVGATVDGNIDYFGDQVRLRGTFVPLYGLNNIFGQLPVVGIFLGGGSNEGLLGVTYEVVGTPGAPVLRVNPISAVAPGLLRKFFEFPGARTPPQSMPDQLR